MIFSISPFPKWVNFFNPFYFVVKKIRAKQYRYTWIDLYDISSSPESPRFQRYVIALVVIVE